MTTEFRLLILVIVAAAVIVIVTIAWSVDRKARQMPEWPKSAPTMHAAPIIQINPPPSTTYDQTLAVVHAAIERAQESSKRSQVPK